MTKRLSQEVIACCCVSPCRLAAPNYHCPLCVDTEKLGKAIARLLQQQICVNRTRVKNGRINSPFHANVPHSKQRQVHKEFVLTSTRTLTNVNNASQKPSAVLSVKELLVSETLSLMRCAHIEKHHTHTSYQI